MVGASMQKLKSLLEDLERFLEEIQRKENLSPWALKERARVLNARLRDFRNGNSELLVEDKTGHPNSVEPDDDLYDDTCATTDRATPSAEGLLDEDIYEDTDMPDTTSPAKSRTESVGETSSKHEDEDSVAAKDIENPQMSGYMEKKKKSDSKLTSKIFGGGFKNHYVVIKDGILYFYKKETDKAQKETLNIEGYDIRPIPGLNKDKAEKSIQLFCPARATYEFLAPSKDECKKWTRALEAVLGKNTLDSASTTEGTEDIDDLDGGGDYEDADAAVKGVHVKPITPDEETYDDTTVQPDQPPQPDWGKLPLPSDDLYEETEVAPPQRPNKLVLQKSSLHGTPKPLAAAPAETYDDTVAPPAIAEEIYDDNAPPIEEDIYDDAAVPPTQGRPPAKLPAVTQVKSQMQSRPPAPVPSRPPAPVPIEEEMYDDTNVPPPPPTAKLPQRPAQSRPLAPPPDPEEDEEYDDVASISFQRPQKPAPKVEEYPGIDDYDDMYLSKWDHSPQKTDELCMKRGDMICVLDKLYRDWWVGRNGNKVGLVPHVYLMKAYDICVE